MEQSKVKNALEIATNIAVLLVAVTVLTVFALNFYTKPQPQLRQGLQRGDTIPQLQGLNYRDASQTLLIALNTRCGYCNESIPFYQQLVQQEFSKPTRIVALFPNSESEVRQFTQQNQLNIDTIADVDFRMFNLIGTPTMILVDDEGAVNDFWLGKLSRDDEHRVIQALNHPPSNEY